MRYFVPCKVLRPRPTYGQTEATWKHYGLFTVNPWGGQNIPILFGLVSTFVPVELSPRPNHQCHTKGFSFHFRADPLGRHQIFLNPWKTLLNYLNYLPKVNSPLRISSDSHLVNIIGLNFCLSLHTWFNIYTPTVSVRVNCTGLDILAPNKFIVGCVTCYWFVLSSASLTLNPSSCELFGPAAYFTRSPQTTGIRSFLLPTCVFTVISLAYLATGIS